MNSNKRILTSIGLVIVFGVIITLRNALERGRQNIKPNEIEIPENVFTEDEIVDDINIDTGRVVGNIYTNNDLHFQLSIPSDWLFIGQSELESFYIETGEETYLDRRQFFPLFELYEDYENDLGNIFTATVYSKYIGVQPGERYLDDEDSFIRRVLKYTNPTADHLEEKQTETINGTLFTFHTCTNNYEDMPVVIEDYYIKKIDDLFLVFSFYYNDMEMSYSLREIIQTFEMNDVEEDVIQ